MIKTLGDEVMVVGPDAAGADRLGGRLQRRSRRTSRRRGSASTTARRSTATATTSAARSTRPRASWRGRGGGEVLVTRPVVDVAAGVDGSQFERIGEVRLKGFSEPTELFLASARAAVARTAVSARREEVPRTAVRAGGLLAASARVLAMLSGGRDSVCLLDVAVALLGGRRGCRRCTSTTGCATRPSDDERHCRELCAQLGVALDGRARRAARRGRRGQPAGLGARRSATRGAARSAGAHDALIATGHTATTRSRRSSTASPPRPGGARCSAWRRAEGRLIRPLLGVTREQTAAYCRRAA